MADIPGQLLGVSNSATSLKDNLSVSIKILNSTSKNVSDNIHKSNACQWETDYVKSGISIQWNTM